MSDELKIEIFRVEGHRKGVPFACRIRLPSGKSKLVKHPDGTIRMFPNETIAIKAGKNVADRLGVNNA